MSFQPSSISASSYLRIFLLCAFCCEFSFIAGAETIQLNPVADTTLLEEFSDNNMGGHTHLAAGLTRTGNSRRALLRFDLEGQIPADAAILSAELTLDVTLAGNTNNGAMFELLRVLKDWEEGDKDSNLGRAAENGEATWLSRRHQGELWDSPGMQQGGDFAEAASSMTFVGDLGTYTWTGLEGDVQSWLDDSSTNFGWLFKDQAESTNQTARRFASREDTARAPILTIEFEAGPSFLPGDANEDGVVGLEDFVILKDNFGATNATRQLGDFNEDGQVGLDDFVILKDNFGTTEGNAVPEPSSACLALLGLLAIIHGSRQAVRLRRSR